MKNIILIVTLLPAFILSCGKKNNTTGNSPVINGHLNRAWLKSIEKESDSTYHKPYFRRDFVTAWYFLNNKKNSVCQEMRDSSDNVRQVIITINNIRTYFAQYYPDGQVMSTANVDGSGKFSGEAVNYFPSGKIKSKGTYKNGLYNGIWETYDESGRLLFQEEYDSNGAVKNTIRY